MRFCGSSLANISRLSEVINFFQVFARRPANTSSRQKVSHTVARLLNRKTKQNYYEFSQAWVRTLIIIFRRHGWKNFKKNLKSSTSKKLGTASFSL